MDKVDKLPTEAITAVEEARKVYDAVLADITERVNYIIRFILSEVGGKLEWWSWSNSHEDDPMGDFFSSYHADTVEITGKWTCGGKLKIIDKDGEEWSLEFGEFPARWLHEDFEEEYKAGLKLYQDRKLKQLNEDKAKKAKKEAEKKEALAAVSKKLTKEEMQVLGLKFERKT